MFAEMIIFKRRKGFMINLIKFLTLRLTLLAQHKIAKRHAVYITTRASTRWLVRGGGERVFCNPPFSRKAEFIAKAYNEVINGDCPVVVMVLPSNCQDGRAFQQYIKKQFFYETLSGRVAFINPTTGQPQQGNNAGTTIVYFKKDITR